MSAVTASPGATETFRASLARATADERFAAAFYARFLASSPAVAAVFAATEVAKLERKLRSSLHVMTLAADDTPGTEPYLDYLGAVHARLHIRPWMYDAWLQALVATVAECDPGFSPGIERAWRLVIGASLAQIKRATDPSGPAASGG